MAKWVGPRATLALLKTKQTRLRAVEAALGERLATDWAETTEAERAANDWNALVGTLRAFKLRVAPPGREVKAGISLAKEFFSDARFDEAARVLRAVLPEKGGLSPALLELYARVERARSRYRQASRLLEFAHSDKQSRVEALVDDAEIAWIEHDYARGERRCETALTLIPGHARAQKVKARCEAPLTVLGQAARTGQFLSHAAYYVSHSGNFGDVSLPAAVREAFEHRHDVAGWLPVHVHQLFDRERVRLVNRTSGLIVGGGGLFLPDTSPNGNSGWQWNVPTPMLDALDVPLAVFAVGFNLFPGQEFTSGLFQRSLVALAERASFIGLRNHGSMAKVQTLLPPHLADKIAYVPCPTTVLSRTHARRAKDTLPGAGPVLINAAFDRSARRFGDGYPEFLSQMRVAIRKLQERGTEVRFASHLPSDERFVKDLDERFGVRLEIDRFHAMELEDGYEVYRKASLVVGMRGHATMIPFGLGTPVLSIVSHPKLRYFLEDLDRVQWAIDVADPHLGSALYEKASAILDDPASVRADIAQLQSGLLAVIDAETQRFFELL